MATSPRRREGAGVGQQEFELFNEQHIEKGKVMKMAKYLNRLVFVSGFELATGARVIIVGYLIRRKFLKTGS